MIKRIGTTSSVALSGALRNGESGLTLRFRSASGGAGAASQRVRNTRAYRVVHVSQRQLVGLGKKKPGR
jgi:hypothetical protein